VAADQVPGALEIQSVGGELGRVLLRPLRLQAHVLAAPEEGPEGARAVCALHVEEAGAVVPDLLP